MAIAICVAACILLPLYANRRLTMRARVNLSRVLALLTAFAVTSRTVHELSTGVFDWREDLPLNFCNIGALIAPLIMWHPTKRVHEILYFIVLAGTLQGVITPDLDEAFPHYHFIAYWIIHGGLVAYVIFVTVSLKLIPDLKGLLYAFLAINIYSFAMMGLNALVGTNYMYMMEKPPTQTILDFMGPWPWYILVCEFVGLLLFFLSYLPIAVWKRRSTVGR